MLTSKSRTSAVESNVFAADFLKVRTVADAAKEARGELREVCTDLATYFYGNCEVIVSPVDETQEEMTFFVDTFGYRQLLVAG